MKYVSINPPKHLLTRTATANRTFDGKIRVNWMQ